MNFLMLLQGVSSGAHVTPRHDKGTFQECLILLAFLCNVSKPGGA